MARDETIRQRMKRLQRQVEHTVRRARRSGGTQINIVRRTNVVVSANVGQDGAVHHASAQQNAPIYQSGGPGSSNPVDKE